MTLEKPPFPETATSSRRTLLLGAAVAAVAHAMPRSPAMAQTPPAEPSALFKTALDTLANGRPINSGRVTLEIPRLAESGNSVQLKVVVESPMTPTDTVRRVHLLSEQNPIAKIATFHFSPGSGRAEVETYVRLATTQNVHAIAELSDGSVWSAKAESVVLLAACLDGG